MVCLYSLVEQQSLLLPLHPQYWWDYMCRCWGLPEVFMILKEALILEWVAYSDGPRDGFKLLSNLNAWVTLVISCDIDHATPNKGLALRCICQDIKSIYDWTHCERKQDVLASITSTTQVDGRVTPHKRKQHYCAPLQTCFLVAECGASRVSPNRLSSRMNYQSEIWLASHGESRCKSKVYTCTAISCGLSCGQLRSTVVLQKYGRRFVNLQFSAACCHYMMLNTIEHSTLFFFPFVLEIFIILSFLSAEYSVGGIKQKSVWIYGR